MKDFDRSLPMLLYRALDLIMPRFRAIFGRFGLQLGELRLGGTRLGRLGLGFGQVLECIERITAAAATDLACGLLQYFRCHAKGCAAIRALCIHCSALSPRTRQPRPRLAVLLPEYGFVELDPGVVRCENLRCLFT